MSYNQEQIKQILRSPEMQDVIKKAIRDAIQAATADLPGIVSAEIQRAREKQVLQ